MIHGRSGKYTAELVAEVCRAARKGDETHREIAKRLGITLYVVRGILQHSILGNRIEPKRPGEPLSEHPEDYEAEIGLELRGEDKARYERFVRDGFPKGFPTYRTHEEVTAQQREENRRK